MTEERPRRKPGREPGKYKQYAAQHAVRFTAEQWATIGALAELWHVSEAEVIRRAVELLARQERAE